MSNWSRGWFLLTQFMQPLHQLFQPAPPHRPFFIAGAIAARQDVKLAILLAQFALHRVTHLRPWLGQEFLLHLAEPPAWCAHRIMRGGFRRPHLGQHRLGGMPRSITQVRPALP